MCSDPERGNPKISEREYQVLIGRWSYNKKKGPEIQGLKSFLFREEEFKEKGWKLAR